MRPKIQTECEVSGSLCFILGLARVVGAAPLCFEKDSNVWRVHVSRKLYIYGRILILFLVSLCSASLVPDDECADYSMKVTKNRILWAIDIVGACILSLAVVYTAINRMSCLIHCVAHIKQINEDLKDFGQVMPSNKSNNIIICTFMLILFCIVSGNDSSIVIYDFLYTETCGLLSTFYVAFFVCFLIIILYVLQFYLTVLSVLSTLRLLNNHLKTLLLPLYGNAADHLTTLPYQTTAFIKKDIRIDVLNHITSDKRITDSVAAITNSDKDKATAVTLRRLGLMYCSLCDVIGILIDSNGITLVVLFATTVLHLILALYYLINGIWSRNIIIAIKQLVWVTTYCAQLLLVTERCHRTHEEMDLTKDLLNVIRQSTATENAAIIKELKVFYRHLILNQITYSPLDLFTLNRLLLTAILSNIITYFVIVVRF